MAIFCKTKLSCLKLLKGVLIYYTVTIVLSSIQLTDSQFEDSLTDNMTNESTLDPACINSVQSLNCCELPAVCVECDFFQDGLPQCNYTESTNFNCWALPDVECKVCSCLRFPWIIIIAYLHCEIWLWLVQGDHNFSQTFPCRYCYQTRDDEQCCSPNESCDVSSNTIIITLLKCSHWLILQVRGTPSSTYISQCTANADVYCLRELYQQGMLCIHFNVHGTFIYIVHYYSIIYMRFTVIISSLCWV